MGIIDNCGELTWGKCITGFNIVMGKYWAKSQRNYYCGDLIVIINRSGTSIGDGLALETVARETILSIILQ